MNLRVFFFLLLIALSSNSNAQWWVDGGNAIWPHGNVLITKGGLKSLNTYDGYNKLLNAWNDAPVSNNYLIGSQESWWGLWTVINWADNNNREILQNNSRLLGIDEKSLTLGDTLLTSVGMTVEIGVTPNSDSSSVWKTSWSDLSGYSAAVKFRGDGLPHPTNPSSSIVGYSFFEDGIGQTVIDTVGFKLFGHTFRFGAGNKLRYPETYAFYSDMVSYNAATKILNKNAYHFYGKGDYPSYFGGAMIQKVYTYDVQNPPDNGDLESNFGSASAVGPGFTAYIDDNGEGLNFYQVVSDGNVWWVFTATQAP